MLRKQFLIEKGKKVCYNCKAWWGKEGGDVMAEQKKLILGNIAYTEIEGRKKVERLTNVSYDAAARRADKRIEENNREYAATYKKAALFSAKQ